MPMKKIQSLRVEFVVPESLVIDADMLTFSLAREVGRSMNGQHLGSDPRVLEFRNAEEADLEKVKKVMQNAGLSVVKAEFYEHT